MTFKNFQACWVFLRGPTEPHPFLAKTTVSKFCLHGVDYDLKRLFKTFQTYSVSLRGVAGPDIFRKS